MDRFFENSFRTVNLVTSTTVVCHGFYGQLDRLVTWRPQGQGIGRARETENQREKMVSSGIKMLLCVGIQESSSEDTISRTRVGKLHSSPSYRFVFFAVRCFDRILVEAESDP
jgi:hypothetical protein